MLIVVIAGVIFIPDLLDGKKELVKEEFKKIPPKPIVEQSPIVSEFPKQKVTDAINAAASLSEETADDEVQTHSSLNNRSNDDTERTVEQTAKQPENQASQSSNDNTAVVVKIEQPEKIQSEPEFEKSAWVLRLGTFRNKPNVNALLSKLEEAGVTTFVKPVEAKAGTLYRVFVGPELDKASLESAQNTLRELTGLDGKITQFQPVN